MTPAAPNLWMDYFKLLLVLGGILILAYLVMRYWLPRIPAVRGWSGGPIQVLGRYPLEARKSLYVVKAGPEYLLLGASEASVQFLKTLDAEAMRAWEASQGGGARPGADFASLLRRIRGGRV